jgi:Rhamnan synthesis protein F
MSLPPGWKVKRELNRIRDQILRKITTYSEPRVRILHNFWLTIKAQPITGNVPMGNKVAIFILFQQNGVARSTYLTCDHLIEQGYSPFVLSNAPLSDTDRAALLARSAILLERPNFGYDFGAYQDGIRILGKMGCRPDRLILMNDSTWFPIRANDTSIARMEASGEAFTGQVEKIESDIRDYNGIDHLESHLLMFTKPALECSAFVDFWKDYPASSNRTNTILQGEKKLSDTMFKAGFVSSGLVSRQQFLNCVSSLSYVQLQAVVTEFCDVRDDVTYSLRKLIQNMQDTPEWREDAMQQLKNLVFTHNYLLSTTFVFATMTYLGLGFVKKGHEKIAQVTRRKVLSLAGSAKIEPLDPIVRAEIEQVVANWTTKK